MTLTTLISLLAIINGLAHLWTLTQAKQTRQTYVSHVGKLLELLSQADIKLPSGATIRYNPGDTKTSLEDTNTMEWLDRIQAEYQRDHS